MNSGTGAEQEWRDGDRILNSRFKANSVSVTPFLFRLRP